MQPHINHNNENNLTPENLGFSVIDNKNYHKYQSFEEDNEAASFQKLLSEYMIKIQKRNAINTGIASCIVSIITAPMLTLATSMQLSFNESSKRYK